jgi:hypothetical protein
MNGRALNSVVVGTASGPGGDCGHRGAVGGGKEALLVSVVRVTRAERQGIGCRVAKGGVVEIVRFVGGHQKEGGRVEVFKDDKGVNG